MKNKIKHYFITVDWCNKGKRGIFSNRAGTGYWQEQPHTYEEMYEILGHFAIILNPKSEPFTEEELKETRKWIPLAEYKDQFGIAVLEKSLIK